MKHKVYIDGQAGTTGLQLRQKLQNHKDVEILLISEELRKDEAERKRLMNEAEVVFLCLPDDAAREAVKLVENPNTCIIDASTAHRTDPDWVYGFPLCIRKKSDMQSALPTPAAMPQALLRRFIPSFGLVSSGRIIP